MQVRALSETKVRALLHRNAWLWKASKASYLAWRKLALGVTWKSKRNVVAQQPGGLQVHLGCGDRGIVGMLNIDARVTHVTDMVADCSRLRGFDDSSLVMIFSNAFFEHLYRRQQLPLLRDCARTLKPGGIVLFLGISDFGSVSREYLDAGDGKIGEYSRLV